MILTETMNGLRRTEKWMAALLPKGIIKPQSTIQSLSPHNPPRCQAAPASFLTGTRQTFGDNTVIRQATAPQWVGGWGCCWWIELMKSAPIGQHTKQKHKNRHSYTAEAHFHNPETLHHCSCPLSLTLPSSTSWNPNINPGDLQGMERQILKIQSISLFSGFSLSTKHPGSFTLKTELQHFLQLKWMGTWFKMEKDNKTQYQSKCPEATRSQINLKRCYLLPFC